MTHRPSPQADGHPGTNPLHDRVRTWLADFCALEEDEIRPDVRLDDISVGLPGGTIELQLALEDDFQLRIDDAAMDTLQTVGDLQQYLETRLSPANSVTS